MRLTIMVASAVAMLATAAQAFEVQTDALPAATGDAANLGFIPNLDGSSMVLERFADSDDPTKPGKFQAFGNDIQTYGIPNYIPGPNAETPYWVYSTPGFRSSVR